ncbi:MAG: hypothetical protein CUN51_06510 [Candidatus Thermofonsia Clade 1 bacterium]|uniref:Uncharacterized protein n=1 Tax=Candidatus Thermofonsia Clade 1 bacterium TaxID=2364210 RepID=A0A2M8NZW2_9CHLR|nr:MAG: hypothetical protein CUN51_06510 [Candidatus Thermofonsia Clade 1 bacterium]
MMAFKPRLSFLSVILGALLAVSACSGAPAESPAPPVTAAAETPVAVSPTLAVSVKVEDLERAAEIGRLGRGKLSEVAYSPDGRQLAAASSVGIWLYDLQSQDSAPRPLEGHAGKVNAVAWSPDGRLIASGADDKRVML